MILGVSIGNTNIRCVMGTSESYRQLLLPASEISSAEEFSARLQNGFGQTIREDTEGSVIASVVPSKTEMIAKAVRTLTNVTPQLVDASRCGFDVSEYGDALGQDRAVCIAAAIAGYPTPLIVVDFGTATTVNLVSEDKKFLGGAILAGIKMGAGALSQNTALLPVTEDFLDVRLLGRNTRESIASGAAMGAAYAIEGYIKRIDGALGKKPAVVITGGNAPAVLPHCEFDHAYEPDLLLAGLFILYDREDNG